MGQAEQTATVARNVHTYKAARTVTTDDHEGMLSRARRNAQPMRDAHVIEYLAERDWQECAKAHRAQLAARKGAQELLMWSAQDTIAARIAAEQAAADSERAFLAMVRKAAAKARPAMVAWRTAQRLAAEYMATLAA